MANPEHVAIVRKGAAAIEEWRNKNPEQILYLAKADLSETNLSKANLQETALQRADLSDANLHKANLSKARLFQAILEGANLSKAILSETQLHMANLYKANFSRANISNADLTNTNLMEANLIEAQILKAHMPFSNLTRANLRDTDLSRSDLSVSDLTGVNLSKANLSGVDLSFSTIHFAKLLETNFSKTNLSWTKLINFDASKVNLTGARMNGTLLGNCNLAHTVGLAAVKHEGPSRIDLDTLTNSFKEAGNRFTPELEIFFLNAGVPKQFLDALPGILVNVRYCTTFVCYGEPNRAFAERLEKDLRTNDVSCWVYPMHYTPGERTWEEITRKRREAEKMVVLCSAPALVREGVLKEIEEQIDEDPDKMVPISLDNLWKQDGFLVKRGQRDLKPFLLERNYADFSDESKYNDAFRRLLKGIKRT